MEECVNVYQKQRDDLLVLARRIGQDARAKTDDGSDIDGRPAKRRRTRQSNAVNSTSEVPMRATRSQSRRSPEARQASGERFIIEDSEDDGSQYLENDDTSSPPESRLSEPDDGLVACPMCHARMKEEAVFTHLDQCEGSATKARSSTTERKQSTSVAYSVPTNEGETAIGSTQLFTADRDSAEKKTGRDWHSISRVEATDAEKAHGMDEPLERELRFQLSQDQTRTASRAGHLGEDSGPADCECSGTLRRHGKRL